MDGLAFSNVFLFKTTSYTVVFNITLTFSLGAVIQGKKNKNKKIDKKNNVNLAIKKLMPLKWR